MEEILRELESSLRNLKALEDKIREIRESYEPFIPFYDLRKSYICPRIKYTRW